MTLLFYHSLSAAFINWLSSLWNPSLTVSFHLLTMAIIPTSPLASSEIAPRKRPSVENPLYAQRAESGLYDGIADQLAAMKDKALCNIDFPDDFTRHIEGWSKNYKFMDKDGNEMRTAIVGEIAGPALGTVLRAHGTYYSRSGDDVRSFILLLVPYPDPAPSV